jgi:hypothetical protein
MDFKTVDLSGFKGLSVSDAYCYSLEEMDAGTYTVERTDSGTVIRGVDEAVKKAASKKKDRDTDEPGPVCVKRAKVEQPSKGQVENITDKDSAGNRTDKKKKKKKKKKGKTEEGIDLDNPISEDGQPQNAKKTEKTTMCEICGVKVNNKALPMHLQGKRHKHNAQAKKVAPSAITLTGETAPTPEPRNSPAGSSSSSGNGNSSGTGSDKENDKEQACTTDGTDQKKKKKKKKKKKDPEMLLARKDAMDHMLQQIDSKICCGGGCGGRGDSWDPSEWEGVETEWDKLGLCTVLRNTLLKNRFVTPTPIQVGGTSTTGSGTRETLQ